MAERRRLRRNAAELNKLPSLELLGSWFTPGGSNSHRRGEDEETDPGLSFRDQSKFKQDEGFPKQNGVHIRDYCA